MTFTLTPQGLTVLYKAMNGSRLHFNHAAIGNGNHQSLDQITDLANPLLTIQFDSITVDETNAILRATFNNSSVESGFRMTEVGVFCEDPNNSSRSVLFAYASEPIESANWIAPANSQLQETELSFVVFVGNAENISAQINESAVYATQADLNRHINNTRNPHSVTKSQIGLGNVPNVATNDQTPTFAIPTKTESITSGEKLGLMFGKIARAILDLISHLANKNNPHNVTASQVGAAKSSHTHSSSDINSGTLLVQRGGTGLSSLQKGLLFYAKSANVIGQISAPSGPNEVLRQDVGGDPYFGPLTAAQVGAASSNHTHIDTGSYMGNGGVGANNANSIAFSKTPSLIVISQAIGAIARFAIISPLSNHGICFGTDIESTNLFVSHTDTTVSWYYPGSEGHPANQMNGNGLTYNYVAIF